jgi:hypothetical protein
VPTAELDHLAGRPGVRRAVTFEIPAERQASDGVFVEAWRLASARAHALGAPSLDACEIPSRAGTLVMARSGDRVACALIDPDLPAAIVRYELAEALAAPTLAHADSR